MKKISHKIMKAAAVQLLILTGEVWQDLAAAAHNITRKNLTATAHNISGKKLCQHQWRGSKIIGCGGMGCAFDVYSEEGVRGVKKVYHANSSSRSKHGEVIDHPLMMHQGGSDPVTHLMLPMEYPRIFKSAVESLERLDGQCSVAPALDICDGRSGYLPYIVYAWKGTTTIQSYYLDAKRPIPGILLTSWFEYAMHYVAPCIANHGLVVYEKFPQETF